jgi:hypothetical protein
MPFVEGPGGGSVVIVASQREERDVLVTFCWVYNPDLRTTGARVVRQDKYGQKWTLDIPHTYVVTQYVAAGLLRVSVMTINKWVREGKLGKVRRRNGVSVISMVALRKMADERNMGLPF